MREDLTALCEHASSGARPFGTPAAPVKLVLAWAEKLGLSPLYEWVNPDLPWYLFGDR